MTQRGFVVGDRIIGSTADSHADLCAGYGEIGMFRFVGASVIGKSHIRDGSPRDDAFAVRSAGEWLAVAVADGMGSRKRSRYGASYAVEALCSLQIDQEMRKDLSLSQNSTRLLSWLANYEARGSSDDRTLVMLMRSELDQNSNETIDETHDPNSDE